MANEYLTSSNFGTIAGSLLSKKQKDYKDSVLKSFGFSLLENYLDAADKAQTTDKEDAVNEILTNYDSIFKINQEEFNQFDRNKIDEYVKNPETFLNKEAASQINNTNFAIENNITWQNRMNESPEVQAKLIETFNSLRNDIDEEYKILQTNPKYTSKTSEEYNSFAKAQLLAELNLVKNDPRRKSLIKRFWNNTFRRKTDPDGNLVSTNPEIIELEDEVLVAKVNRNTFRQRVKDADLALEEYYKNLTNKSLNELETVIKKQTKIFTEKELEDKTNNTIKYFVDDKGKYTNFGNTELLIGIVGKNKNNEDTVNTIDIKKKIRKNQIVVLDENNEVEPLSQNILFESISLKRLDMSYQFEQENQNPLVGPTAIHAVLESFNQNGRFKVDGKNIIFTPPGRRMQNNIDADDASALLQENGKPLDDTPDISQSDEQIVPRYSTATALNFIEGLRLENKSEEEIELAINNMKNIYPGSTTEIDLINNSTRLEFLKQARNKLTAHMEGKTKGLFGGSLGPRIRKGTDRMLEKAGMNLDEMYKFSDLGTLKEINEQIALLEQEEKE
tara:strand:- start:7294 stop:8976 length:1683 start_codon:yes stop_codon:yes gene_type:complete